MLEEIFEDERYLHEIQHSVLKVIGGAVQHYHEMELHKRREDESVESEREEKEVFVMGHQIAFDDE